MNFIHLSMNLLQNFINFIFCLHAFFQYDGSVSSGSLEGRSLSPVRSDESSSSPTTSQTNPTSNKPFRKRRPAPKPPTTQVNTFLFQVLINKDLESLVVKLSNNKFQGNFLIHVLNGKKT